MAQICGTSNDDESGIGALAEEVSDQLANRLRGDRAPFVRAGAPFVRSRDVALRRRLPEYARGAPNGEVACLEAGRLSLLSASRRG